jgi:hypothetical protein
MRKPSSSHARHAGVATAARRLARRGGSFVRALAAFVLAVSAGTAPAQALKPLPADFLATLAAVDAAVDGIAPVVRRFKADDLSIRSPLPAQIDAAITRFDRAVATVRSQTAELRRRESLRVLLGMKGTLGAFTSDVTAVTGFLQSATVRNPDALEKLERELAELEKHQKALAAAFARFDAGAEALLDRLDAQAPGGR